ncbi:MAG: HNH endonuclease [Alphaproteobacteria bacterium]|nr:HNH endonuclease [Alphaproteobacteria bacterium]
MVKAVFTTKVEPTYDDLPEARYHFPRTYLRQAEAAVGDWIVYYEPRRTSGDRGSSGGRQAYFATARVREIQPDPAIPDHFYAFVEDYLEFDDPVPFRDGDFYYERILQRDDGETNKGAFGRAVRTVPDREYDLIARAGFARIIRPEAQRGVGSPGLADEQPEFERPIVERLVARPFRDAAFATAVKAAYDITCAITGLRIINGGGRPEVQAAHIRPVASLGPDSVRNGLALSGTVHWMFDRGLIALDADHAILMARDRVPEEVQRLINPDRRLRPPARPEFQPHPQFLEYHREHVFKG